MLEDKTPYGLKPLPWHAFQKALAAELQGPVREAAPRLTLDSWLARALVGSAQPEPRC